MNNTKSQNHFKLIPVKRIPDAIIRNGLYVVLFITFFLPSGVGICSETIKSKNLDIPQSSYTVGNNGTINQNNSHRDVGDTQFADQGFDPLTQNNRAQPAWAQGAYHTQEFSKLRPFGSELFTGNFAGTFQTDINPEYQVATGDRIALRMWGARTLESILTVDLQGNIFIPEIGPVKVAGCSAASLTAVIKSAVASVFTDNVDLYVNLQSSQPVAVFVTGFVNSPGRYSGSHNDNVLSYIDRAGGINALQGSYREILVKRRGKIVKTIDLYKFITEGVIPIFTLENDDVIVISPKKISASVYGVVKKPAVYEFTAQNHLGRDLVSLTGLNADVTHVQISGFTNNATYNRYITISEFLNTSINPDDRIMFVSDSQLGTILTSVIGPIQGKSRFIVSKGTHLTDVLKNIRIMEETADVRSVYIRRKSVADQQKIIIDEALKRLEQSSLTAESSSVDEASIRVKEAELIQDFVKRAQAIKPDGVVVVSANGKVNDIILEDGDQIIIPERTDVIQVGGEVLMPKALVFNAEYGIEDYISETGGFSQRADKENILVVLPNGQVGSFSQMAIQPGSRVIVMPKVDSKNMQFAKDVMQIIYQLAVATKVVIGL